MWASILSWQFVKSKQLVLLLYLFYLFIAACAPLPETAVSPTPAVMTPPPVSTATVPPPTPQPTATAEAPIEPTVTPLQPTLPAAPVADPVDSTIISPENAAQLTQIAHYGNGRIDNISWSPDGTIFAVGGYQGVDFYDAQTLQALRSVSEGDRSGISSAAVSFSPGADTFVVFDSGYEVPGVTLWETASGQQLRFLDTWFLPAFTADGQTVIYVSSGTASLHWEDVRTGENQRTVQLESANAWYQLSPNGELVAEVNLEVTDRVVQLWSTESNQQLHTFELPTAVRKMTFTSQGDLLAVSSDDGIVRVWDVPSGALLHNLEGHDAVFSADGRLLATGDEITVRLWDVGTGQLLHLFALPQPRPRSSGSSIAFSPDGGELAVISQGVVLFYDTASGSLQRTLDDYAFVPTGLAFRADSSTLIVVGGIEMHTWDVQQQLLLQNQAIEAPVSRIAISQDGQYLALAGGEEQYYLQMMDTATGQLLYAIEDELAPINEVTFSPDGRLLATRSGLDWTEPVVQVRRTETGQLVFSHPANRFAFSPDGRYFATSLQADDGDSAAVAVWDTATFELLQQFEGLTLLLFSTDGNIVAEYHGEGWLVDIDSGEPLRRFVEGELPYRALAFSPDGRLLLGINFLGYLTLWDAGSGQVLWGQSVGATGAFSPDGRLLATISGDGIVRLWGVP